MNGVENTIVMTYEMIPNEYSIFRPASGLLQQIP